MHKVELNETEMNYLRVLTQLLMDVTDPSQPTTSSKVFIDKKIIKDLEHLYLTLGRIGTWHKLAAVPGMK